MATLSKVFILDKYFTELQKFWETEKKLQDASSSNEAVHLQQRLKSLSTELVTLRNRLHVDHQDVQQQQQQRVGTSTLTSAEKPILMPSNANNNNESTLSASNLNNNHTNNNNNNHNTAICLMDTGTLQNYGLKTMPSVLNQNNAGFSTFPSSKTQQQQQHHPANTNNKNILDARDACQKKPLITKLRNINLPYPLPVAYNERGENEHIADSEQTLHATKSLTALPGAANYPMIATHINHTQTHTQNLLLPKNINDLIQLTGPLTEDAVMRTLQARFNENLYFTNVGPILLAINPYLDVGNPLTLTSTRTLPLAAQLCKIVQEVVRLQAETGYPQAIILSGCSGAGKTHCSMLLLRQLFTIAGGGETDAFKHLAAAFTVLRSLGSAKTATNAESSRIGQFIEVQVTDGALYRTKIHCYFLDQTRVISTMAKEKNYHIFYQMLAGLSKEEKTKLHLDNYSARNLRYLQSSCDFAQNEQEDASRFQVWKTCLGILGIPFFDVVRVLSAVLLLGNLKFTDEGVQVGTESDSEAELNAVASLLGVPPAALFRGLTTRTYAPYNGRGQQLVKSLCDANVASNTRDSLAKALYCRTVATIVRRANSLKRLGSALGTLSSDSNDSVHNPADSSSQHASTIGGSGGNAGSKSMTALNNAVRHAITDGFIGILDMFGFEEPLPKMHAKLEHLCINLCAETMQHFYNTHIFKSAVESCRDEGIGFDAEIDYIDNVPCIDLISSLRTGLLSMLDAECAVRGTAESYVAKIRAQHRNSSRIEVRHELHVFAIRHFAGRVEYDATNFLETNRDVVPDDLVAVFYKHTCNFGFATHLFGSELKALYALPNAPRGLSFRISPTSHTDLLNGNEPISTLTQDFHTRLDNLLRTLVHARPHFVRCIRSNATETSNHFDRFTVMKQIRSLQVLETVNLMASGFPHRMRFKQFITRYRILAPLRMLKRHEERSPEDCTLLLLQISMENAPAAATSAAAEHTVILNWAMGKRHIFLTEGIRQHLEHLRCEVREKSATLIQAVWRGWQLRKKHQQQHHHHHLHNHHHNHSQQQQQPKHLSCNLKNPTISMIKKSSLVTANSGAFKVTNDIRNSEPRLASKGVNTFTRPRPQPITGTPPPDLNYKCDAKYMQQTCSFYGLDLERPPPVPSPRSYVILGNYKLGYPQSRVMKSNFPDDSVLHHSTTLDQLKKGEKVIVVGPSNFRGRLVVEHKHKSLHVPFNAMQFGNNNNNNCTQHSNDLVQI